MVPTWKKKNALSKSQSLWEQNKNSCWPDFRWSTSQWEHLSIFFVCLFLKFSTDIYFGLWALIMLVLRQCDPLKAVKADRSFAKLVSDCNQGPSCSARWTARVQRQFGPGEQCKSSSGSLVFQMASSVHLPKITEAEVIQSSSSVCFRWFVQNNIHKYWHFKTIFSRMFANSCAATQ